MRTHSVRFTSRCLGLFVVLLFSTGHLRAYGPTGHEIVGAIADKRLAGKPAGARISALIDGLTLERAAVMADEIKGWDKRGADDPGVFHFLAHPKIDQQLRDFWRANPPTHDSKSVVPSHHWFHYTDVPVFDLQKYPDGKVGRTQWDIVHMISFCVSVLKGETPEDNPRKITKPVAIILLAHYVGDIHQPLHVGAEYFDEAGHTINPDKGGQALESEGGNTLILQLNEQTNFRAIKLHSFWDNDGVMMNLPPTGETMTKEERHEIINAGKASLVEKLAKEEPGNWRLSPSIALKDYAENWVNEILPISREAYERLQFKEIKPFQEEDGKVVAAGDVAEKTPADHVTYPEWTAKIVREELHKAGWRLADLLEQSVQ